MFMTDQRMQRVGWGLRRGVLGCWGVVLALVLSGGAAVQAEPTAKISPFGIGGDSQTSRWPEKWMPQMAEAGIRTARTVQMHWGIVERERGEWDFSEFERQMALYQELGITSGGLLLGNPRWNHKVDPRGNMPVNNLEAWSEYVTRVVTQADGRIRYWEVWNEAPNFTNNAPPEDYAKVLIAAYDAAKAADPDALVGLAVKSVHLNYIDRVIRAGGKDHFDYISLHPYETLGFVTDSPDAEPVFMNIVPAVRKLLAELQPDKIDCPIWITELGSNADRKGEDIQAEALVKAYAMGIAQGIETITWFEGMDGDSGPMGLLKKDGTPRLSYTAMSSMTTHLGTYPEALGWLMIDGESYAFVFDGAQGKVLITWATLGTTRNVDFGQSVTVIDPLNGKQRQAEQLELTNSPVIVLDPPSSMVAEAEGNRDRQPTWGGDYASAQSVSIEMGEQTLERGLHTRGGDSLKADVLDYGGSARAGDAPGGNVYMVDPTFMTYTTEPIEITAEVRRTPENKPAKLILEYESTTGYQKPEPFVIPDNQQWHTATWRLDDPQFVGKYAFNFRFNNAKYYIRKVTVTKLNP